MRSTIILVVLLAAAVFTHGRPDNKRGTLHSHVAHLATDGNDTILNSDLKLTLKVYDRLAAE